MDSATGAYRHYISVRVQRQYGQYGGGLRVGGAGSREAEGRRYGWYERYGRYGRNSLS